MSESSRTFFMIKPDGVRKALVGEIIRRVEGAGPKLLGLKMLQLGRAKAEELYAVHRGRPFFDELVDFVVSGPVVLMVVEGADVVGKVRGLMGATDPNEAAPGTIRGDLAEGIAENLVHGSDSTDNAAREISLFFDEDELSQPSPAEHPSVGHQEASSIGNSG